MVQGQTVKARLSQRVSSNLVKLVDLLLTQHAYPDPQIMLRQLAVNSMLVFH
jgi:hypothetical protein